MTQDIVDLPTADDTAASKAVRPPRPPHPPLTSLDRCDSRTVTVDVMGSPKGNRCGAQAFVRAVLQSGDDLVFCAHHGKKVEAALLKIGAYLVDESHRINIKEADPSKQQV